MAFATGQTPAEQGCAQRATRVHVQTTSGGSSGTQDVENNSKTPGSRASSNMPRDSACAAPARARGGKHCGHTATMDDGHAPQVLLWMTRAIALPMPAAGVDGPMAIVAFALRDRIARKVGGRPAKKGISDDVGNAASMALQARKRPPPHIRTRTPPQPTKYQAMGTHLH